MLTIYYLLSSSTHFELIELGGIYKDLVGQQDLNALM